MSSGDEVDLKLNNRKLGLHLTQFWRDHFLFEFYLILATSMLWNNFLRILNHFLVQVNSLLFPHFFKGENVLILESFYHFESKLEWFEINLFIGYSILQINTVFLVINISEKNVYYKRTILEFFVSNQ